MHRQQQQGVDIAGFFAVQIEILMRNDFGERYLHIAYLFGVFAWLSGLTALFYWGIKIDDWQILASDQHLAGLFGIFTFLLALKSILHQGDIFSRHRSADKEIHSWSSGRPHKFWFAFLPFENDINGQFTVERFFEPLPFFLIGAFLFLYVSQVFGAYLLICNTSMMFKSFVNYFAWKNMRLDLADGPLLHQSLVGTKVRRDVAEVSSAGNDSSRRSQKDLSVHAVIKRIDPALRDIMEERQETHQPDKD